MNLHQLFEGWRNNLLPPSKLKKAIALVSKERIEICRGCEFNSRNTKDTWIIRRDEHCIDCGCTLSAKTKCLSCECPLPIPKWKAVLTEEQEEIWKQN
jgi:hypothetical protein